MANLWLEFPSVLVEGNKVFRAMIRDVRFEELPPGHVTPPARGPMSPKRDARAREVVFSTIVREGEVW